MVRDSMNDLFRLLLPSWSFFDQPGDELRTLLVLFKNGQPIVERDWPEMPEKRNLWRLIFNPAGNDWHYSKQLELKAALLSQLHSSHPKDLFASREFRKYLDHISESVGPETFDTMTVNLEIKKRDAGTGFENLLSLTLPIVSKRPL